MASDKLIDTLQVISELEDPTQSDLVDEMGKSRSTISRRVNQLEENNWISRREAGRTKIISITDQGNEIAELSSSDTTPCPQQRNSQDDQVTGEIRLHKVAIAFGIQEAPITDGWEKKIIESEDVRYRDLEGDNSLIYTEEFTVRFTPRKAVFLIRNVTGKDANRVTDRSIDRAKSHRDQIEGRLPFSLSTEPINFRAEVSEREYAIVKHPLAEAVIQDSPISAEAVEFFPNSEDHEIWIDDSGGNKEIETGKGAPFDEEDIDLLRRDLEEKVANPDKTERRWDLPGELDDLKAEKSQNEDKIDDLENATRVLLARELRKARQEEEDSSSETKRTPAEAEGRANKQERNSQNNLTQGRDNSESKEDPINQIKTGIKRLITSFLR